MFEYLPELRTLATFVERVYQLFALEQSEHQAYCRRAALLHNGAFAEVPELAKALQMLDDVRFPKMIAFLKSPAAKRMRTNNHVERTNRKLRTMRKCGTSGGNGGASSASSSWRLIAGGENIIPPHQSRGDQHRNPTTISLRQQTAESAQNVRPEPLTTCRDEREVFTFRVGNRTNSRATL